MPYDYNGKPDIYYEMYNVEYRDQIYQVWKILKDRS